jgi:3-oxoacyl-[acyl-carrier-protein] synthase II
VRRDRVLVTGVGPVTSIGIGASAFHRAQLAAVSGTRQLSRFVAEGLTGYPAGEVDLPAELQVSRRQAATTDRCAQLGLVAAELAVRDAGLDPSSLDRRRVGVVIGTGIGGAQTWQDSVIDAARRDPARLSSRSIPKAMCNSVVAVVAIEYGFAGPTLTPVLACAAGAEALVAAFQMITSGEADVVLAGGAEAPLVRTVVGGFASMRALTGPTDAPHTASRPFHADRDGFVLAEGAAVLVLEAEAHAARRGAVALAEMAGYGRATDAFHVTAPARDGDGARRAVEAALKHARLKPGDIRYVNAHGTATVLNDAAEVLALRRALGPDASRTPVSSTKSQTGHALGASGAIEAVATVQAVAAGVIPPTINLTVPDPALEMDFVAGAAREARVTTALSNSFAFGGHNVVLAFTRA